MLKNYLKSYLYLFSSILILTIILSLLNYFLTFPTKIIKLLIPIISIFISSIILGESSKEKAYLEGLKFTSLYIILSIIISIMHNKTSCGMSSIRTINFISYINSTHILSEFSFINLTI